MPSTQICKTVFCKFPICSVKVPLVQFYYIKIILISAIKRNFFKKLTSQWTLDLNWKYLYDAHRAFIWRPKYVYNACSLKFSNCTDYIRILVENVDIYLKLHQRVVVITSLEFFLKVAARKKFQNSQENPSTEILFLVQLQAWVLVYRTPAWRWQFLVINNLLPGKVNICAT